MLNRVSKLSQVGWSLINLLIANPPPWRDHMRLIKMTGKMETSEMISSRTFFNLKYSSSRITSAKQAWLRSRSSKDRSIQSVRRPKTGVFTALISSIRLHTNIILIHLTELHFSVSSASRRRDLGLRTSTKCWIILGFKALTSIYFSWRSTRMFLLMGSIWLVLHYERACKDDNYNGILTLSSRTAFEILKIRS